MENEIELKIMLSPENVGPVTAWLNGQVCLEKVQLELGNTYYDTADQFFAGQKMGLRVRQQNGQYELTLKTKGNIVGGLHIRPEYNLPLENAEPDFKRLNSHYNLQMPELGQLKALFSTDFTRQTWLIEQGQSQLEIALDQGLIKNQFGSEAICELELELKSGRVEDLFAFLRELPKYDGMWLSSLSKAQRGYLVGNQARIAKEIEKLTACYDSTKPQASQYQLLQQLADFLRLDPSNPGLQAYFPEIKSVADLKSAAYLAHNLTILQHNLVNLS
ncbi:adenylate cyclase [Pasteurellaceae bacterium RH1A]|nr:adenylate cyclase [Pasteurellaceae bacterium RH1A]